ncbi:hypothetical protein QJQ45_014261, partial [Haematococcus lacustris]
MLDNSSTRYAAILSSGIHCRPPSYAWFVLPLLADPLLQLHFDDGDMLDETQPGQPPPEHACCYCGLHNAASVAKCLATGKWFCNGRSTSAGSCIIVHLVKSKHKEVQLHKDSPLGDAVLECYASGSRNVFVLGFVPVRGENTVVLLARDTPVNHPTIKDLNLDLSQWQPVVEERALVSWLVKIPNEREMYRARKLSLALISRLEEAWKQRPDARLDTLGAAGEEEEQATRVQAVALRYTDVHQYHSVFRPLIALEAEYDRRMKESQSRDNIVLRWDWGLNRRRTAWFLFPKDDTELRLVPGDELRLRHTNASNRGPWEGVGWVLRFDQSEEVCLEMKTNDVPEDCLVGYRVELVWRSTPFDRMRTALTCLDQDRTSISGFLYHTLLGHEPEPVSLRLQPPRKGLAVPSLPDLNHSQLAALKAVLAAPLSLVQGPPGTGKTVTSAAIVYHIVQPNDLATHCPTQLYLNPHCPWQACKRPNEPCVLVAAPSNVAVDQLAQKISQTGLKVVRLCAKSREDVLSPCQHLTLHYQVKHVEAPGAELFRKLLQLKEDQGGLRAEDEKQLFNLRKRLEAQLLEAADVVCCTCMGAGDMRLSTFRFHHVLIDEATQAAEPECLIPLIMGAKQVQYRMHPCLSEFPSNMFYEGTLQNGTGVGDRQLSGVDFPWPQPDKPMMFYCQLGAEEISGSGTSFLNRTEATNVEKIVTRFLQPLLSPADAPQHGVNPGQIGVITPYEGQRAHVVSVMARSGTLRQDLYTDIEVSSVDAFQGREKDIIILSCVRSNEQQSLGFLGDPRRLNVALTRARYGLVILGNPRVLSRQPLWNALLVHFREAGCLVEGALSNLKPSMVQLSKPKKTFDRSSFGVGALTTNRYQPPERVGDPLPSRAAQQDAIRPIASSMLAGSFGSNGQANGGAKGPGGGGARRGAGPASSQGAGTGAAASSQAAFMPFAAPTYAIPSDAGLGSAR